MLTDKEGQQLAERADKLELEINSVAAEFKAIMADVAKRCPGSIILVPVEVVSETKGLEDER